MKRIWLFPLLLLFTGCASPAPAADSVSKETPQVMGVTMPPKWTETATVTVSPTSTGTPAPTEPPTPTIAVTPLPDGIIARRPTEGDWKLS